MIDYGYKVALGPLREADLALYFSWRNCPEVYRWCRQYEPLVWENHLKWYRSLPDRPDIKMYGVYDDSRPIGVCGLTSLDMVNRRAEFSLYIGPENWGSWHGGKALKTLCAHGFLALGLNHIFGETFEGNPAAGVFEDVGFKKEGTRRGFYYRQGEFIDAHLYSILSKEFIAKWKPRVRF